MLSSSSGFLPYSTTFLQELEGSVGGGEEADEPITPSSSSSKKQKRRQSTNNSNLIKIVTSLDCGSSTNNSFKCVPLSDDGFFYAIATTDSNAAVFFTGFGSITLLKGSMNINGFDAEIGKEIIIKRSSWLPAVRIWCNDTSIHSFQTVDGASYQTKKPGPVKLSTLSKQAKEKLNALNLNGIKCCFVLQGLKVEDQEWMIRVEDKSMFSANSMQPVLSTASASWTTIEVISCITGLLGNTSYFSSTNIDMMTLPPSWVSTVDSIITENTMLRNQVADISTANANAKLSKYQNPSQKQSSSNLLSFNDISNSPIVSMVCGAKGAGKSSYMKYLVNRLLSYSKTIMGSEFAQVCVIDCDLGQPELTMPGMVSLNVVTSPLVSSSHLHLQSPVASVFLGDITSRYEPETFCTALKKLQQHYISLQDDYVERIQQQSGNATSKTQSSKSQAMSTSSSASLGSNKFSLLHDEDQSMKVTTTATSSSSTKKVSLISEGSVDGTWRIPLIINTDGNVQYMGAEILSAIADIFQPTHMIHLASLRSRPLPIFEVLRRRVNTSNQIEWDSSKAAVKCRFLNAERGREGASKVSPIDLRNIRMISYFLRNVDIRLPSNIIPKAKLETSISRSNVINQSNTAIDLVEDVRGDEDDEMIAINDEDNRSRDIDTLYIKNAKFVGAEQCGALAFGMIERYMRENGQDGLSHYLLPFDRVIFNDNRDEVSDFHSFACYNILAAINGELVGLSTYSDDSHQSISTITTTFRQQLDHNSSSSDIQVQSFESFQVLNCQGIALVRCVDIHRRCIVVAAPTMIKLSLGKIILTTGVSLTLPNAAYCGFGFPTYPYSVSELCGEGSVQSKVRSSVKRKIGGNN